MAAKKEKGISKVRSIIQEELADLGDEGHQDEAFTPNVRTPSDEVYDSEEHVIDELLASVPRSQGFYLKLYKELRPNEFELKLRIDNYELWTDMELEITQLVRAYTIESPKKWGSGRYKVNVWKEGGVRGPQYKPSFFYVDAMETETKDTIVNVPVGNASEDMQSQIQMLTSLMSVMRQANPTLTPDQIQKNITESFQQGLQISARTEASETNTNNNMMSNMLTLITTLMGNKPEMPKLPDPTRQMADMMQVMTSMGLLGKKEDSDGGMMKTIGMLKDLGLVNGPQKATDPISQLSGLKDIIAMVKGIAGTDANPPTTMEKIIDVIGPKIPEIVGKLTKTVDGALELKKIQLLGHSPAELMPGQVDAGRIPLKHNPEAESMHGRQEDFSFFSEPPKTHPSTLTKENNQPVPAQPTPQGGEPVIHPLLQELHKIVLTNDETRFGEIKNMTYEMDGGTGQLFNSIVTGELKPEELVQSLINLGGNTFREPTFANKLNTIVHKFVEWSKSPNSAGIPAHCEKCNLEFEYESKAFFDEDAKKCTEEYGGVSCGGNIILSNSTPVKTEEPIIGEGASIEAIGG